MRIEPQTAADMRRQNPFFRAAGPEKTFTPCGKSPVRAGHRAGRVK